MSYWACFQCDLLFEVDPGQATTCPRCQDRLVRHQPDQIFELSGDPKTESPSEKEVSETQPSASMPVKPARASILEQTRILTPAGMAELRERRSQGRSGLGKEPVKETEVWTSANEPTQLVPLETQESAPEATDVGPDPSPRARKRRGPRVSVPAPKAVKRRTLDHAQPRPLDYDSETERNKGADLLAEPGVFDDVSDAVPDAVRALVDRHLDESIELAGPSQLVGAPTVNTSWGTGVTIAVLLGLIVAAILTRPGEGPTERSLPDERESPAQLAPVFDSLGVKLMPASGVELFVEKGWLALGQEAARAATGSVPGLTSLRALTRSIIEDESGPYVQTVTKAFKGKANGSLFGLAFDPSGTAEDLALIVGSLERAGYSKFGLLAERRLDGRVGHFPFTMGKATVPAIGHAVVRVENLGVRADIVARDGEAAKPLGLLFKDLSNGELNFEALDARLESLNVRFPLVRVATVHLETGLDIGSIVRLLEIVRQGPTKERFTQLRLVVR